MDQLHHLAAVCLAGIDDKSGMLFTDLRSADRVAFESGLFGYLDTDPAGREVMQAVRDTGDLSAQAEEQLRAVLAAFTERFRSAE